MKIDIELIKEIAVDAGKEILKIYEEDFSVEYKDNTSPLTKADLAANEVIVDRLAELYPDIPMLSEENKLIEYDVRKDWSRFWLIDPLDGTKEFIKKNGEFTVNIALIENGIPIIGVVHVPVKNITYYAIDNESFMEEEGAPIKRLPYFTSPDDELTVVASRSHMSDETEQYITDISEGKKVNLISSGSSIKLCLVAEGKADVYPRLAPTMEWDTAAAQAVVNGANKEVIQYGTSEILKYNKENLLNAWFVVQ